MEISHVRNSLNMLAKNHTMFCINHGARYNNNLKIDKMTESELRDTLTHACEDPKWFKLLIAEQCFGPNEFPEIMKDLAANS